MPSYSFLDRNTNEEFDISMSINDIDQYEKDNPHLQRIYSQMNLCDPVTIGVSRPPDDFSKYVLGRVKTMPGAKNDVIEKRWEIKREI